MAVALEFLNLIVPLDAMRRCATLGPFERAALTASGPQVWEVQWHDGRLYRDGAMSGSDLDDIVDEWVRRGLQVFDESTGRRVWRDLCVVASQQGVAPGECPWLRYDAETNSVALVGAPRGPVVGPERIAGGLERALAARRRGDEETALWILEPLARRYDVTAALQLAELYQERAGREADPVRAAAAAEEARARRAHVDVCREAQELMGHYPDRADEGDG
jgi:hypothetical protein